MKILLIGPNWHGGITEYCRDALDELGHEVKVYYYQHSLPSSFLTKLKQKILKNIFNKDRNNISLINQNLIREALSFKPDLLIIVKGETISPESLAKIKAVLKVPIFSWWIDNPFAGIHSSKILDSRAYIDHLFVFDPVYIDKLRQGGFRNVSYLPFACNPKIHKKLSLSNKEREYYSSDISFLGIRYDFREEILSRLTSFDLKVWGTGWEHARSELRRRVINRFVPNDEAVKIYNASKIVLNINHPQSKTATNTRTFEAAGCGSFQLTENKSEMKNLFSLGEEAICYNSINELVDLIKYYLKNEKERMIIAQKGQQRVYKDHTYEDRMNKILS